MFDQLSGSGSFARVYEGTIPNAVVKHSKDARDDEWLVWAVYCMKQADPLPWMPRIHFLSIDWAKNEFFALMEKLTPQNSPLEKVVCVCEEMTHVQRIMNAIKRSGIDMDKSLEGFEEVMLDLTRIISDYEPDLFFFDGHDKNWMYRGEQIVLIDPFNRYGLDNSLLVTSMAEGTNSIVFTQ